MGQRPPPPEQQQNMAQLTKQSRDPATTTASVTCRVPVPQLLRKSRHETESLCRKAGRKRRPRTFPPHSLSGSADFTCHGFAWRGESARGSAQEGEGQGLNLSSCEWDALENKASISVSCHCDIRKPDRSASRP